MSLFSWLFNAFDSGSSISYSNDHLFDITAINPASGLPMIDGIGSIDVAGNVWGTDHSTDHFGISSFNDDWSCGSSSMFSDF